MDEITIRVLKSLQVVGDEGVVEFQSRKTKLTSPLSDDGLPVTRVCNRSGRGSGLWGCNRGC
jgi:hypothetical protein